MGNLVVLLRLRGQLVWNAVRGLRRQSLLKVAVVSSAGLVFWLGIFAASFSGFAFVARFLGDLELLTETLLSMFFLLLLAMLLFSNALIAYGSLFRSDEMEFLLTSPVEAESVFGYRLCESLAFSSWAFLVLGLPLMLGYGLSVGADLPRMGSMPVFYEIRPSWWVANVHVLGPWLLSHWYFPVMVVAYFVPFVLIPASVGNLIALALARYLPDRVKRVLGLSVVAILTLLVSLVFWVHGTLGANTMLTEAWVYRLLGRMTFARSVFLPSYWMTQGLVACAHGEAGATAYYFLLLVSTAGMGLVACEAASRRMLRQGWSRSCSHNGARQHANGGWLEKRHASPLRLLVAKDWRLFSRDPVQWAQCAILFGLMGFYVLNLRTFSYHVARPQWKNFTALLNLAATSFVLATVTTRFIFPLLSLEGRRFWLLGLAPVRRSTLLWAKFVFSFVTALFVTVPLIVLSDYMLQLPAVTLWHHGMASVLICFGVSGLSVGLGALYPNWRETNPSKIVAGFGGTLNLLLSVGFVIVMVGVTALPYVLHAAELGQGTPAVGYSLLGAAAAGAMVGLLPMIAGLRALARLEF